MESPRGQAHRWIVRIQFLLPCGLDATPRKLFSRLFPKPPSLVLVVGATVVEPAHWARELHIPEVRITRVRLHAQHRLTAAAEGKSVSGHITRRNALQSGVLGSWISNPSKADWLPAHKSDFPRNQPRRNRIRRPGPLALVLQGCQESIRAPFVFLHLFNEADFFCDFSR